MDKAISFIKENRTLIKIVASIIGVAIFAFSLMNINKETISKQVLIDNWQSQLPAEHFLKDEKWWAEKEFSILQSKLKESFIGSAKSTEKVLVKKMGGMGIAYNVYKFFSGDKANYELKNESGVSVEKIMTSVDNLTQIQLFKNDKELSFVLTEEDFENQALEHDNLINWIFPENYVMASIEDTDIAIINENFILGKIEGTTTLRLYIDNRVLVYTINVDS